VLLHQEPTRLTRSQGDYARRKVHQIRAGSAIACHWLLHIASTTPTVLSCEGESAVGL